MLKKCIYHVIYLTFFIKFDFFISSRCMIFFMGMYDISFNSNNFDQGISRKIKPTLMLKNILFEFFFKEVKLAYLNCTWENQI